MQKHFIMLNLRKKKKKGQKFWSDIDKYCFCYDIFRPGPSSPLPWVRECVLQLAPHTQWRHKILLGINMYGLDFSSHGGAEPLLGGRYALH